MTIELRILQNMGGLGSIEKVCVPAVQARKNLAGGACR